MERRLILAIALSISVLLIWSSFIRKLSPPPEVSSTEKSIISQPSLVKQEPEPEPSSSNLFNYSQEKFEVTFIEPQGAIREITFKDYQSYKFPLKYGLLLKEKNLVFQKQSVSEEGVSFIYQDPEKQIIKRFIFHNSNYTMDLEIEVQNLSNSSISIKLPLVLGVLTFAQGRIQAHYKDVTAALKDKILHLNVRKDMVLEEIKFLGLRDRYFCAIIEPVSKDYTGFVKRINSQEFEVGLNAKEVLLTASQKVGEKFRIYLGPQDLGLIKRTKPEWTAVIYYGTFNFISQLLLQSLEFFYRLCHNWGLAIIILSLVIYIILFPLTLKQMRSMKQMQALQPRIEELRKTYKDNPQRLNKETLELYRQYRVNPFSGCLPLILQIPIFFALYQALMRSIALKGAQFLWIKDLSEPDRLFILPVALPILGKEINILPILMTIMMFIQQKISTVPTSTGSTEQQKLMMILFPLLFGFIFYHMPAGLVLYWFINSLLMVSYQFRITLFK